MFKAQQKKPRISRADAPLAACDVAWPISMQLPIRAAVSMCFALASDYGRRGIFSRVQDAVVLASGQGQEAGAGASRAAQAGAECLGLVGAVDPVREAQGVRKLTAFACAR